MTSVPAVQERAEIGSHEEASPDLMSRLLHLALEKGVSAESLERLTALHERVADRAARIEFFAALARFQEICPPITYSRNVDYVTRDGTRVQYGYAELPHIAKAIAPLLKQCGLSYGWDSEAKGETLVVTCNLRHVNGHAERSTFSVPTMSSAGMSPAQKFGAAGTYARRQSLIQVLGLTTTEGDPDGRQADLDPTPISAKELEELETLIEARKLNVRRILKMAGVVKLEEITAGDLPALVNTILEYPVKDGAK